VYKATPRTKTSTDPRYRVLRGGGWYGITASIFRSASRFRGTPAGRSDNVGFRCVQRGARMTLKVTQ
jgi:formylglycine-generating enzyme required for sulfatase activity